MAKSIVYEEFTYKIPGKRVWKVFKPGPHNDMTREQVAALVAAKKGRAVGR